MNETCKACLVWRIENGNVKRSGEAYFFQNLGQYEETLSCQKSGSWQRRTQSISQTQSQILIHHHKVLCYWGNLSLQHPWILLIGALLIYPPFSSISDRYFPNVMHIYIVKPVNNNISNEKQWHALTRTMLLWVYTFEETSLRMWHASINLLTWIQSHDTFKRWNVEFGTIMDQLVHSPSFERFLLFRIPWICFGVYVSAFCVQIYGGLYNETDPSKSRLTLFPSFFSTISNV